MRTILTLVGKDFANFRRNRAALVLTFLVPVVLIYIFGQVFGLNLKILSDPRNEIETQTVNGLLQKTIFSNVPEVLGQSLQARAKQALGPARLDRFNDGLASAITGAFGGDPAKTKQRIASGD